jgi:hypothetical protein
MAVIDPLLVEAAIDAGWDLFPTRDSLGDATPAQPTFESHTGHARPARMRCYDRAVANEGGLR